MGFQVLVVQSRFAVSTVRKLFLQEPVAREKLAFPLSGVWGFCSANALQNPHFFFLPAQEWAGPGVG
jgi:hypothetical protein